MGKPGSLSLFAYLDDKAQSRAGEGNKRPLTPPWSPKPVDVEGNANQADMTMAAEKQRRQRVQLAVEIAELKDLQRSNRESMLARIDAAKSKLQQQRVELAKQRTQFDDALLASNPAEMALLKRVNRQIRFLEEKIADGEASVAKWQASYQSMIVGNTPDTPIGRAMASLPLEPSYDDLLKLQGVVAESNAREAKLAARTTQVEARVEPMPREKVYLQERI